MDIMLMGWVKQFVAKAIAGAGGGVAPVVVSALPATGTPEINTTYYLAAPTEQEVSNV